MLLFLSFVVFSFQSVYPLRILTFRNRSAIGDLRPNRSVFDYDYRLPKTIIPSHYKLSLQIDAGKEEVKGNVTIVATAAPGTDRLVVHADQKYIGQITGFVEQGSRGKVPLEGGIVNKTRQTITYKFSNAAKKTEQWIIHAQFVSRVAKSRYSMNGLFKVHAETGNRFVALLEMFGARKLFPSFDEPQLKARFELEIQLVNFYKDVTVVSNSMRKRNGNIWAFAPTPRMSTYLLTFGVGNYKPVCLDIGPREKCHTKLLPGESNKVCHWNPPRHAKYTGPEQEFNLFGLTTYCKLQKYLHAQNPVQLQFLVDHAKGYALEDWGLIYMGFKGKSVYAHEITHYWFGDMVGPMSWPHLWLNEGFATFFSVYSSLLINYTRSGISQKAKSAIDSLAAYDDGTSSALVDNVWANDYDNWNTPHIDDISYHKGAMVIKMINDTVGEKCFRDALIHYVESHKFQSANTTDLLSSFQSSVNKYKVYGWEKGKLLDINSFLHPYLYKSGVPKLTFRILSEKKVRFHKKVPKGQKPQDWPLPIWGFDKKGGKGVSKMYWIMNEVTDLKSHIEWNKFHTSYCTIRWEKLE